MACRIVLDARRIADFGIGTYIRNLVHSLAKLDNVNHYTLITPAPSLAEFEGLPPNFETTVYETKKAKSSPAQFGFSLFLRRLSADLFHIPLNAVPLWMPNPYVVTIHDMSSLLFAESSGYRSNLRLFYLRRGLARADRVLTVSSATRRDVASVLRIPSERVQVVYNAPDPTFRQAGSPGMDTDGHDFAWPTEIQRVLERYRIHYPFLLYVGRTNSQKNIPRLVEAFAVLRGEIQEHPRYRELRLIIIGDEIARHPALRHAVIQSRVEDSVRFLGFVPIETLRAFYQAASAFVFPSLYEGFGLPPLEAMACGTPVVCSHVASLPEVVGHAALIVNPENVFDIARGMREVLVNPELRSDLIHRGLIQAGQFSWERTAAQVLRTYEELTSTKNRPR